MGTIVIDTNILAASLITKEQKNNKESWKKRRIVISFLTDVEEYKVKIGTDADRLIESQYQNYIKMVPELQNWWSQMEKMKLVARFSISKKGPYPTGPHNSLDKVDKILLDVASMTDTKILVSEDSDFYEDKSLESPHPVVKERGVKLKKLSEAYREVREWDP